MSISTPALLVPPVRLGRLLGEARLTKGESLEDLSRRCGLAFDERWFADVESGQVELDEPTVRWLSEVYGIQSSTLVPARSELIIDLNEGNVRVGQTKVDLKAQRPERVLVSYLALVHALRDVPIGSPLLLRQIDIGVLSEALRKSERSIESELGRLLAAENPVVGKRILGLRRRLIVPVAGILVGLTAVGGLLLVQSNDVGARPEATALVSNGSSGQSVPVDIGTAVYEQRTSNSDPGVLVVRGG